ncbi:nucleotidyltransferase domain-containing protein [Endozoicomonas sp.]|uniref:nucleotidyltransferase domain-containing protein n=1 Tax=Endozoicomonas sp. TaxID=1892382 RepID=UPI00383AE714
MDNPMRLTQQEQQTIKTTITRYDPKARVLLFGSRTDPNKKGGDIDLLVISEKLGFTHKLNILADLHQQLGEQKIDILLDKDGTGDFGKTILPTAIEL